LCNRLIATVAQSGFPIHHLPAKVQHRVMAVYRFHVDVDVPPQTVAERLRSIVREKPTFWESFRMAWRARELASPPFIGTVQDDSFRLRRDIRYRNSFLPLVWGRFISTPTGTRVSVTMFIHPLVALFMAFWLGMVGYGALKDRSTPPVVLWGMFIFGLALTAGGFFPEAIKARRLISATVLDSAANTVGKEPFTESLL
jgi:hypothetical protein